MAKVKVKLRLSTVEGGRGTIYYCVTHKGEIRHISTKIKILPTEWEAEESRIKSYNKDFSLLQNKIESDVRLINKIIDRLNSRSGIFSVDDIIKQFRNPLQFISVVDFFEDQIKFLQECKRLGTATNYQMVLNTLLGFLDGEDLHFNELTSGFVERFGDHLKKKGIIRNSFSCYMRVLRAIFNKGVRLGYTEQNFPFQHTYTGIDHTRKKAVKEEIIYELIKLDLSHKPHLSFARDLFLFSFYTRGMSFVDMAYLKKEDILDGYISYSRHKTGQTMRIKIEPFIQIIIDRHSPKDSNLPYVFPILKDVGAMESFKGYRTGLRIYNSRLKKLSNLLGLKTNISSYTARHTWATTARNHNIPVSIISAGMGHSSEKTTQIYLNSIENSLIDNANRGIMDIINKPHSY